MINIFLELATKTYKKLVTLLGYAIPSQSTHSWLRWQLQSIRKENPNPYVKVIFIFRFPWTF